MLKLMLCAMLLALPSCSTKVPVAQPIEPCIIPKKPVIKLNASACGNDVCLPVENAVALARFLNATVERNLALARCPYVKESDD